MAKSPISLVLVGIGGMGNVYVEELFKRDGEGLFSIAGLVDPAPERCPRLAELTARGIPVFPDLAGFYAARGTADLAVISSPIQFHAAQTILALEKGSYVLCEKPVAATIQEARAMAAAERRTERWAAVGYQWSFSRAVQSLKTDIMAGIYGRPVKMRCLYTWPRDKAYYGRNDWAGRARTSDGGWVLDGPANNAMAHDLHNMLYLLGRDVRSCAMPVRIEAELYRANPIENCDTAAARLELEDSTPVLFWVSHATRHDRGPRLRLEFDKGIVTAERRGGSLLGETAGGVIRDYGYPDLAPMKKLWDAIDAVRTGTVPVCCVEAAAGQTLAIDGMQDSAGTVVDFPAGLRRESANTASSWVWIEGLDEALAAGFEASRLPSELGLPWARPGRPVDLTDYREFPGPR
ncbi:MAG: Gfo/Idh/MocA family oxidoreductase [Candidatus Aminicenantes bacterium]|nr:Gfo/Idh/MocA family oxidoreductase [Candidatus Aminicenantes bacterium]